MIKFSIRGENIEVTEAIRDYVEAKVSKIEKYFNEEQELHARINLKVYREKTAKVEVTVPLGNLTLRAEDVSQDLYGSVDLVVDKIERQIRKNKTKIAKKHRSASAGQVFAAAFAAEEDPELLPPQIVRRKKVQLLPLDIEEAVLQMELLGHDFFVYNDVETHTTNVLYRREDGGIGLLEGAE